MKSLLRSLSSAPVALALALGLLGCTTTPKSTPATARQASFDWPAWRGPSQNGISPEANWLSTWPAQGPTVLWKAAVGIGFSSISVANGRAFTLGNANNQDTVFCFDAATGQELWRHSYPCKLEAKYYEGGPGSTPTVDGDQVYTLSKLGDLFCLEAATGKVLWNTNIVSGLGAKLPTWFLSSSPIVDGERLLLNAGEAGMALNKRTGQALWLSGTAVPGGYSSAVLHGHGPDRAMLLALEKSYAAVRVADGAVLWRHPWVTSYEVNAADAVLAGEQVFLSSGYNKGGTLIRAKAATTETVWENKNLRNQFNPSVLIDGHLYGFDGDGGKPDTKLRCVELATGEVKWSEPTGFGALMAADGKLIAINEKGTLMVIEATPRECKKLSSAQVLGGRCWITPVLSNGRIYCRNAKGDLVCLDVASKPASVAVTQASR